MVVSPATPESRGGQGCPLETPKESRPRRSRTGPGRSRRARSAPRAGETTSSPVEPLLEMDEAGAQVFEGVGVGEPPPLGLGEDEVDALHQVLDGGHQLLLADQVAVVALAEVPA